MSKAGDQSWSRIAALLEDALTRPPAERAAWLAEHCPDAELRDEVLRLVAAHERGGGILDRLPGDDQPAVDLTERVEQLLADRYRIDRELGRGGMATVFLAEERKHDRPVVLKVLNPEIAAAWSTDRFEREVRIAAQLRHPHIVGLIDSGRVAGVWYYVMPYLEGEPLDRRLERLGPLPLPMAMTLLRDIADALAYAHGRGVVHRDLKPANVFCTGDHAFLMDFGIAKLLQPTADTESLTGQGMVLGTPRYMAPEQEGADDAVDERVDLYAWGLLAYEMIIGRRPTRRLLEGGVAEALAQARPELPRETASLITRCLERDPSRRPHDAGVLVDGLQRDTITGAGTPRSTGARRRTVLLAGGALVGSLAVAAVFGLRSDGGGALPGTGSGAVSVPVAVVTLANETGDPSLDIWGRMAGDWLTQGLQETGLVSVVPWPASLLASDRIRVAQAEGEAVDAVAVVNQETGAATVVTGSYYLLGDSVTFRLQITDATDTRLIAAPAPLTAHRDSAPQAIATMRNRLMGAVAVLSDARIELPTQLARRPPIYTAYQAFDRGLERYNAQDYRESIPEFRLAYELDSTFSTALLLAAAAYWNRADYLMVDSMLTLLRRQQDDLSQYDRYTVEYMEALLVGDAQHGLEVMRLAVAAAPGTKIQYNLARLALRTDRPQEALEALEALDPDRGAMRGWSSYWTQLTHALHLLGEHERELVAARELRRRFPDRRVGQVLEARALAASGRLDELDSLLAAARSLPPTTYWSQGAAMVVAGEELQAHGDPVAGRRYLEDAVAWYREQLRVNPEHFGHRYWLGSAYYDLERWEESAAEFASLPEAYDGFGAMGAVTAARLGDAEAAERIIYPDIRVTGSTTAVLARVAAIQGDTERAVALFADATQAGIDGLPWMHASAYHDLRLLSDGSPALPTSLRVD